MTELMAVQSPYSHYFTEPSTVVDSPAKNEPVEKQRSKAALASSVPELVSSLIPNLGLLLTQSTSSTEKRSRWQPSKEMRAALKVLNDSLGRNYAAGSNNAKVTNAVNIVQQSWFGLSSGKASNPHDVEDCLDAVEDISRELMRVVVNMADVNGNTALHYAVSHANFDVVSVLLDSKVINPNILNKVSVPHQVCHNSISPLNISCYQVSLVHSFTLVCHFLS